MNTWRRTLRFLRLRPRRRTALALAGGGVVGGFYEVGAIAAIEQRLGADAAGFDVYVGCSAGSVVAALLANGVRATDIYRILDEDLDDPLNFRRNAVYASDSFRRAFLKVGRLAWAVGKNAVTGLGGSVPDLLARVEGAVPAGIFSLGALENFLRQAFDSRGLPNSFTALPRTLLIPAVDLDTAERAVFGRGSLGDVSISHAVAASSAIPGFFEPYRIGGRDYVDGGVGWTGHADLAAEAGADLVVVVNPLVPTLRDGGPSTRDRGVYSIMEQANRIASQNLLQLGLETLAARYTRTQFLLLQPPRTCTLLSGPSMGFEASRRALRFGYTSTLEWLDGEGADLLRAIGADDPVIATPRLPAAPQIAPA